MSKVEIADHGRCRVVMVNRPEKRNAIDAETADMLYAAFSEVDGDDSIDIAVLTGAGDTFCSGYDLTEVAEGGIDIDLSERAPLGPTRMRMGKPVIAAIEGHAVAGGLELALWCDLRVGSESATLGVLNRRFGVPLVDMGTIRLPRIVGHGRALDLILTGRPVSSAEGLDMGLLNRVVPDGEALAEAIVLAHAIASHPQTAMRNDRASVIEQWGLDEEAAIANEASHGLRSIGSGESVEGASRFRDGSGRHGTFGV